MSAARIDFAPLAWERPAPGVRCKTIACDGRSLRLVEFSREFLESDWCMKEHIGYVLEGEIEIIFGDGRRETFSAGDGIFIREGAPEQHKARVLGSLARLVLVEKA
jgi:hypothetical protein